MTVFGALCGTLLTWGLTALGSALVFVIPESNKYLEQKILDGSLGFAAGVMMAASFWSLLAPAIEMAQSFNGYSESSAFIPATIGFVLGALFVYGCDMIVPDSTDYTFLLAEKKKGTENGDGSRSPPSRSSYASSDMMRSSEDGTLRRRFAEESADIATTVDSRESSRSPSHMVRKTQQRIMIRRMMLLVIAITVHNFPEGLAVGVGFGAVGVSSSATMSKAWNLAIGIGIQNFPEGFAVSMPLHRAGMSKFRSFWIGQLSGIVEPIAGVLGACLVTTAQALLPYSLGFAAGAMIFVVVNDLIPEAQKGGRGSALGSFGAIAGFVVMMALDVAFG